MPRGYDVTARGLQGPPSPALDATNGNFERD
jgi:hypothetical protein